MSMNTETDAHHHAQTIARQMRQRMGFVEVELGRPDLARGDWAVAMNDLDEIQSQLRALHDAVAALEPGISQ